MKLDGSFADAERVGDQRVRETAHDQVQDLRLARGEAPATARGLRQLANRRLASPRPQDRDEPRRLSVPRSGISSQTPPAGAPAIARSSDRAIA